jgi:hypothetical protein
MESAAAAKAKAVRKTWFFMVMFSFLSLKILEFRLLPARVL